jgi:hypothetical protein
MHTEEDKQCPMVSWKSFRFKEIEAALEDLLGAGLP